MIEKAQVGFFAGKSNTFVKFARFHPAFSPSRFSHWCLRKPKTITTPTGSRSTYNPWLLSPSTKIGTSFPERSCLLLTSDRPPMGWMAPSVLATWCSQFSFRPRNRPRGGGLPGLGQLPCCPRPLKTHSRANKWRWVRQPSPCGSKTGGPMARLQITFGELMTQTTERSEL